MIIINYFIANSQSVGQVSLLSYECCRIINYFNFYKFICKVGY